MKARYLYISIMSLAVAMGFTACSSDDDDSIKYKTLPAPVERGEFVVDVDTVEVGVGETASFNISKGGGDYKLINENPDIATASLSGNTVTVNSSEMGWAGVIVSDAKGNYKRVVIRSLYKNMFLDKESVSVGIKLGHTDGQEKITITGGNGGYEAQCADEDIAKVSSVSGNVVTIQAVSAGTTTVTITDVMGVTKAVNVTVKVTTVPFSDSEKSEIMERTSNIISWDGQNSKSYGTYFVDDDNEQKLVQWTSYSYYFAKVWFDGDLSVGKKNNGKVLSKFSRKGSGDTYEDCDVEIIKNDGSRIWGIVSKVGTKNDKDYLFTGYFCVEL